MRRRGPSILLVLVLVLALVAGVGLDLAMAQQPSTTPAVRFAAIDVYLDSAEPFAAWQFELTETNGAMTVVGVESGASSAFAGAPRYDFDAVAEERADRIIVADYSLVPGNELPVGRTRVATLHVRLQGNEAPEFELSLIAAGNAAGNPIPATVAFELN